MVLFSELWYYSTENCEMQLHQERTRKFFAAVIYHARDLTWTSLQCQRDRMICRSSQLENDQN